MKIIYKLCSVVILIIIMLNQFVLYINADNPIKIVTFNNGAYSAWKEITDIKLTLSNGQIIASNGVKSKVDINILEDPGIPNGNSEKNAIEFILDISQSMGDSLVNKNKENYKVYYDGYNEVKEQYQSALFRKKDLESYKIRNGRYLSQSELAELDVQIAEQQKNVDYYDMLEKKFSVFKRLYSDNIKKLDNAKVAFYNLLQNLYNSPNFGNDITKIGLMAFSYNLDYSLFLPRKDHIILQEMSKLSNIFMNTNEFGATDMWSKIRGISPRSGTYILSSLNNCCDLDDDGNLKGIFADSNLDDYNKIIVIISDGVIAEEEREKTKEKLQFLLDNNITVKLIFFGVSKDEENIMKQIFSCIGDDNIKSTTDLEDFFKSNWSSILGQEETNLYEYSGIVSNLTEDNPNMFIVGDEIYIIMDDELLHGATLEVNYTFKVNAFGGDINNYKISDNLSESGLKCDLSKNNGWRYDDTDSGKIVYDGEFISKGSLPAEIYLKLSTMLSSNTDNTFTNKAGIKMNTENGSFQSEDNEMTSYTVSIIPPFGLSESAMENNIKDKIKIIVLSIIALIVIYIIILRIKNKGGRVK